MKWLTTTSVLSPLLGPLFLALTPAMPAEAKQAKCLFEANEAHYIGSVCEFTRTDDQGSFRITDANTGIEAEVKVTAPGKGVASWANPKTKIPRKSLGDVQQAGACWSDGTTYVCAWSPDEDVYLGPFDRKLFVAYGERYGMADEIESAVGLDTSHAVIHTKPSRRAALYYTTTQHDYEKGAVEGAYQERANSKDRTITANCLRKEWTGLQVTLRDSLHYRLLGPFESVDRRKFADNDGVGAKWAILDTDHNRLIGDCGACSYFEIHDWYQKLCPRTAPSEW